MKKALKITGIVLAVAIVLFIFIMGFYLPRYWTHKEKLSLVDTPTDSIMIMSCNVRCLAIQDPFKKSWFYRANLVAENLQYVMPDIVGFQEVTWVHYDYLTDIMVGYDNVITYRDKFVLSEGCPIFYRTDKFELIDKGSFWLSETPEEMSKDWGAANYRICSYVILKDKASEQEIVVFNTHLDNESEEARINGINLVLEKIAEFGEKPAILMGDLNAEPNSVTYNSAVANFNDAQVVAEDTMDSATFQNFGKELDHARIDYFMVSKAGITVEKYATLQNTYDGTYPSDHFPIYIKITLD